MSSSLGGNHTTKDKGKTNTFTTTTTPMSTSPDGSESIPIRCVCNRIIAGQWTKYVEACRTMDEGTALDSADVRCPCGRGAFIANIPITPAERQLSIPKKETAPP